MSNRPLVFMWVCIFAAAICIGIDFHQNRKPKP